MKRNSTRSANPRDPLSCGVPSSAIPATKQVDALKWGARSKSYVFRSDCDDGDLGCNALGLVIRVSATHFETMARNPRGAKYLAGGGVPALFLEGRCAQLDLLQRCTTLLAAARWKLASEFAFTCHPPGSSFGVCQRLRVAITAQPGKFGSQANSGLDNR
jgi:hypothetical protein